HRRLAREHEIDIGSRGCQDVPEVREEGAATLRAVDAAQIQQERTGESEAVEYVRGPFLLREVEPAANDGGSRPGASTRGLHHVSLLFGQINDAACAPEE